MATSQSTRAATAALPTSKKQGKVMTKEEAKKIVGNNTGVPLKNMHRALSMCRWNNTAEMELRLEAACKMLRKKYTPRAY
jgi:hypothetical protein